MLIKRIKNILQTQCTQRDLCDMFARVEGHSFGPVFQLSPVALSWIGAQVVELFVRAKCPKFLQVIGLAPQSKDMGAERKVLINMVFFRNQVRTQY